MKNLFLDLKDKRINFIKKDFEELGYKVFDFEKDINFITNNDVCVLSPAYKWKEEIFNKLPNKIKIFGGNIDENLLKTKQINYYNLMRNENFVLTNANFTAEGFLVDLISNTNSSIYEQNILILGSGRVAKAVAYLLLKLNVNFDIAMRNEKECNHFKLICKNTYNFNEYKDKLKNYDVIINTIPQILFEKNDKNLFKTNCVLFELASIKCLNLNDFSSVNYILCPALPAKYMPRSAGKLVFEIVKNYLQGEI